MTVQFGVHIGPQKAPLGELRNLWKWLDEVGSEWISVWDHVYEAPSEGGTQPHYEAVALLGAIAADTERARLGCLVFCGPYRNVGMLAKSLVSIDHLSGGRFEPGIGSGWYDEEATAFGLPFGSASERFDLLSEQVEVLRRWFAGERVTYDGEHVKLVDAGLVPGPLGRMPLWIGGIGPKKTLRLAGAAADGWNAAYIGPDQFRELNGVLDDWCDKAGRDPADIERSINLIFGLGDDDIATAKARLDEQWGERAARVREGSLLGRPEDAIEQIAPYVEAGADLVNIVIRPPWDHDVLAAYMTEAVPMMRRELG